ncbi:MAG: hypothetical protein EOO24_32755 [Comamonadaceae bacterium]|nr:MAG: hypothetical protein EOO24_32755 [Comamonadaceae bacterium]
MPRADGRHRRQAGHRVEPGADHAAVQPVVLEVADQRGLHRDAPLHAVGLHAGDLQPQHLVEDDLLLEDLLDRRDELGLERHRRRG